MKDGELSIFFCDALDAAHARSMTADPLIRLERIPHQPRTRNVLQTAMKPFAENVRSLVFLESFDRRLERRLSSLPEL